VSFSGHAAAKRSVHQIADPQVWPGVRISLTRFRSFLREYGTENGRIFPSRGHAFQGELSSASPLSPIIGARYRLESR
jgi:hypothetical protein